MAWIPALNVIKPGMIVALWGFGAVLFQKNRPPLPKPIKYMLAFLVLMIWQIPWAMNNRWALWGFRDFATLILGGVIPIALLVSSLGSLRKLLTAYVALHVPMCVYALYHKGYGPAGWLFDNNDLALVMDAGLGLSFFLFLETQSGLKKLFFGSMMVLLVAGVVVTQSRGGFVGLAVLAAFIFFVSSGRRKLIVATAVVVCVIGVLIFAPPSYFTRIKSIQTASNQEDTGFGRLYAWGLAWHMFLDHPIFGVGTNNYGIEGPKYEDLEYAEREGKFIWGRVPHSIYFTLLSEQGMVGAVIFVLVVAWTFSAARRIRRWARAETQNPDSVTAGLFANGLLSAVVAVIVSGVFLSVLYYPVFWVLVGLMAALERLAVTPQSLEPGSAGRPNAWRGTSRAPQSLGIVKA